MTNSVQAEQPRARPALLAPGRVRRGAALAALALGCALLAGAAGWLGWRNSSAHYAAAGYHYDAMVYMLRSAELHNHWRAAGVWPTVVRAAVQKDALDMTLRALLLPQALGHAYGHLTVLLPLLAGFLALLVWYVYRRSGSALAGIAVAGLLFAFPLVYDPFWGLAAYWKDNLAAWLLGSALLAWLLSGGLARRGWAALCGLCLGLLVVQRSATAVYAALLFAPPVLLAAAQIARRAGWRAAVRAVAPLAVPAGLLGGLVLVLQWQLLYGYYLVRGYAYAGPLRVARFLIGGMGFGVVERSVGTFVGIPYGMGYVPLALLPLAAVLLVLTWRRGRPLHDPLCAGWLALGLPALVCLTHTLFHGFFAVWTPLLMVLVGTLVGALVRPGRGRAALAALLVAALLSGSAQDWVAARRYVPLAQSSAPVRDYYDVLGNIIYYGSPKGRYLLAVGEVPGAFDVVLLRAQTFFGRGLFLNKPLFRLPQSDDGYRSQYGDATAAQIAGQVIETVSARGVLLVGECDPAAIPQWRGQPLANQVLAELNRQAWESPRWRAIARVRLPARCALIYRYAPLDLSHEEKWGHLRDHVLPRAAPR